MIKATFILCISWLCAVVLSESSTLTRTESRIPRDDFVRLSRSDPDIDHEVIIAITKPNIVVLEEDLLQRATPGTDIYQQWLTDEEVTKAIQNLDSYEEVKQWLDLNNIEVLWTSRRKDYIKATAKIHRWESFLSATFYSYQDQNLPASGNTFHRSDHYSLPHELLGHVSAIFNTVQTPPKFHPKYMIRPSSAEHGTPSRTNLRFETKSKNRRAVLGATGVVTVSFLNSFYKVSGNGSSKQSQCVFETSTEYFSTSDLTTFQQMYNLKVQSAQSIGGHSLSNPCPTATSGSQTCYEGNLDLQYIMGMAQETTSIFWWVSDTNQDPFLAWITAVADESNPPLVNSISWGADEQSESAAIMNSFNNEAIILASMGVTIFVSSGDNGVADVNGAGNCQCNVNTGINGGQGYFPSFPATSPYVTATGATQGPELGDPEIACQSQEGGIITTGGGFSTYFSRPSWQSEPVSNYLSRLSGSEVPANGYNTQGRGYPDISLIGVDYQVVVGGTVQTLFGTSATAPVLAAFTSLVNAQRLELGMSSVGWINPTLYAVGWNNTKKGTTKVNNIYNANFNDVTSGNNKCCSSSISALATCCNSGFSSAEGWDPVTGWGSIDFTQFAKIFEVSSSSSASQSASGNSSSSSALGSGSFLLIVFVIVGFILLTGAMLYCYNYWWRSRGLPPPVPLAPFDVTIAPPAPPVIVEAVPVELQPTSHPPPTPPRYVSTIARAKPVNDRNRTVELTENPTTTQMINMANPMRAQRSGQPTANTSIRSDSEMSPLRIRSINRMHELSDKAGGLSPLSLSTGRTTASSPIGSGSPPPKPVRGPPKPSRRALERQDFI